MLYEVITIRFNDLMLQWLQRVSSSTVTRRYSVRSASGTPRVSTIRFIYSYEAKWLWDREEDPLKIFTCPAQLEPLLQKRIEEICRQAFLVMRNNFV